MSLLSKPMAAQTLRNIRPPAQNRRLFARLGGPLLLALRICSTGIVFWAKQARSSVRVSRVKCLTPCFSFVNWRVTEGACDIMFQFFPIWSGFNWDFTITPLCLTFTCSTTESVQDVLSSCLAMSTALCGGKALRSTPSTLGR